MYYILTMGVMQICITLYIFMNKWMKTLDMDPVRFLLLIFFHLAHYEKIWSNSDGNSLRYEVILEVNPVRQSQIFQFFWLISTYFDVNAYYQFFLA